MEMNDIKIPDLLVEWGYPDLVDVFREEQFDTSSFLELDNESLTPYISKHGPRLNFLKKLRLLKETLSQGSTVEVVLVTGVPGSCWQSESSGSPIETELSSHVDDHSFEEQERPITSEAIAVEETASKRRYEDIVLEDTLVESAVETLDVRGVLVSDTLCNYFLQQLEKGVAPAGDWRNKVVDVLVSQRLLKLSLHLTLKQLQSVAKKLVQLLPGESLEIYYNDGKRIVGGKLVDKYNNLKAKLKSSKRRCTKNTSTADQPASTSRNGQTLEERQLSLAWLRFNRTPWPEVLHHWAVVYQDRVKLLYPRSKSKKENNIEKYYQEFPVLTDRAGWQLLVADFDKLYADNSGSLFAIWPIVEKAILTCAQSAKDSFVTDVVSRLKNPSGITESAKILLHLMLLPHIFKTNTPVQFPASKETKDKPPPPKKFWKPSLADSRDGFIMRVKDASDVKKRLENRQNLMAKLEIKCQPLIVVIGPTLLNFTHCQVSVNGILYTVPGPLQAVDVVFKSFQVLNAYYPIACEQCWLFIQRELYKIIT